MIFFARRSHREKRWGAVFFLLTGVLVWRGLLLFHSSDLWTALYLASGLVLFLLFYFWLQAGGERGVVVVQLMCALLACAVWLLLAGSWAVSAPCFQQMEEKKDVMFRVGFVLGRYESL